MKKSKGNGKGKGKRCVSGFSSEKMAQRGIPLPKSIKFYPSKWPIETGQVSKS